MRLVPTFLLVLVIAAPVAGALAELAVAAGGPAGRRPGRFAAIGAGVACAGIAGLAVAGLAGSSPAVVGEPVPWLRADPVFLLVGGVASLIGLTVLVYARRALDPGEDALRMATVAPLALAGTMTVAAAGRLSVLVLGWIGASVAVVLLLWHDREPLRRAAARRAALAMGVGDAALLVGAVIVLAIVGDPALDGLAGAVPALADTQLVIGDRVIASALGVVAVLFVVAALARGAQLPLPAWLPGTLAAPTPTSALLHAGVVNAGAVLLIRTFDLFAAAPVAAWALALACGATILVAAGAGLARPDAKGALALSTSAQMGFMLLAVGVGAPGAALTHLAGHACYKSARFLGVGGTVAGTATRRRFRRTGADASVGVRAGRLLVAAGAGSIVAAGAAALLPAADAWIVGAALGATTTIAAAAWLRRPHEAATVAAAGVVGVVALAGLALGAAVTVESQLAAALPTTATALAAPGALAVLAAAGLAGHVALRHPRSAPGLWSRLGAVGRLPISISHHRSLRSQP